MYEETKNHLTLPYDHIKYEGSFKYASLLFDAFNLWFKYDNQNSIKEFKELIELMQNSYLLIDDIEDNSLLRRGLPVSYLVFGHSSTINSAIYHWFLAIRKLTEIAKNENKLANILPSFFDNILKMYEGQSLELYFRDYLKIPTEDEYFKMLDLKVSPFFMNIYQPLRAITGFDLDLDKLCCLFGRYFQIRDDCKNLKSERFAKLKGFAEDLSEGKISLAIIHAVNNNPKDLTIISILKLRTQDNRLKKMVIDCLEKNNSFDYCESVLKGLESEIQIELLKFEENPKFKELLGSVFI